MPPTQIRVDDLQGAQIIALLQEHLAAWTTFGFAICPPFDGYVEDPNSVYMAKDLR